MTLVKRITLIYVSGIKLQQALIPRCIALKMWNHFKTRIVMPRSNSCLFILRLYVARVVCIWTTHSTSEYKMECTLPIAVSACNKLSLLADLERISLVDCIDETDQCISIMAESSTDAIRDLSDFLGKSLNRQILNYSLAYLTKPGDNYGSIIQALTVQTSDGNTSDSVSKTIH